VAPIKLAAKFASDIDKPDGRPNQQPERARIGPFGRRRTNHGATVSAPRHHARSQELYELIANAPDEEVSLEKADSRSDAYW
jgi:hypothetical protein